MIKKRYAQILTTFEGCKDPKRFVFHFKTENDDVEELRSEITELTGNNLNHSKRNTNTDEDEPCKPVLCQIS